MCVCVCVCVCVCAGAGAGACACACVTWVCVCVLVYCTCMFMILQLSHPVSLVSAFHVLFDADSFDIEGLGFTNETLKITSAESNATLVQATGYIHTCTCIMCT